MASSENGFQWKFEEQFADRKNESGEGVGSRCEERIYA